VLLFLTALGAFRKMRPQTIPAGLLVVAGAAQLGPVESDNEGVRGLHAVLALVLLAHAFAQRATHALGMGRHGRTSRHRPWSSRTGCGSSAAGMRDSPVRREAPGGMVGR